jgi:bifunctional non-homologous end joining protein LigD
MLASAGPLPQANSGWAYEMKWDGIRALAFLAGNDGGTRLVSRTGRDISHVYPELQPIAAAAGRLAVLDGEVVAFGDQDWPDFEALQQRMNISSAAQARLLMSQVPVTYLVFDLLFYDGELLLDTPYTRRRQQLEELGLNGQRWQTPPSFGPEAGSDVIAVSKQYGLEGVVAKRLASRYESGRRSTSWRKTKNVRRQEVVVGGWQPGGGGRAGQIGSLLVGVQTADGLAYAGHVGTGFTQQTLQLLAGKLTPLRRAASPFVAEIPAQDAKFAVWVDPVLVAEVAFTNWTRSGRLRAPSYKGLRDDKDPAEVVREP